MRVSLPHKTTMERSAIVQALVALCVTDAIVTVEVVDGRGGVQVMREGVSQLFVFKPTVRRVYLGDDGGWVRDWFVPTGISYQASVRMLVLAQVLAPDGDWRVVGDCTVIDRVSGVRCGNEQEIVDHFG